MYLIVEIFVGLVYFCFISKKRPQLLFTNLSHYYKQFCFDVKKINEIPFILYLFNLFICTNFCHYTFYSTF